MKPRYQIGNDSQKIMWLISGFVMKLRKPHSHFIPWSPRSALPVVFITWIFWASILSGNSEVFCEERIDPPKPGVSYVCSSVEADYQGSCQNQSPVLMGLPVSSYCSMWASDISVTVPTLHLRTVVGAEKELVVRWTRGTKSLSWSCSQIKKKNSLPLYFLQLPPGKVQRQSGRGMRILVDSAVHSSAGLWGTRGK